MEQSASLAPRQEFAMPRIGRTPPRLASLLAGTLLVALAGCDDAGSPTGPESPPALATTAATSLSFRQLSAGSHTCGVATDERAYCWGANSFGIGDGTPLQRLAPVAVSGGLAFVQVSVGVTHTCGVTTDSRAYCWGDNEMGELGDGTITLSWVPVAVAGSRRFRRIVAGYRHTCAVTSFDVAFCWGDNSWGQLGDGTVTERRTPVRVAGGHSFRQVFPGGQHTCGLTADHHAYCWGDNGFRQLGDGTLASGRLKPVAVAGGLLFYQMSAGTMHNCGVATGSVAYCWGLNRDGRLGNGTTSRRGRPTAVAGGLRFAGLNAGVQHTCGLTTTGGRAYCWGNNVYAQLGDGTRTTRLTPVAVAGGLFFDTIDGGYRHTCGVTSSNAAYCWGDNGWGQLGDGTTTTHATPVAVAGPM
jgi:alpha-tubulin suppressor-like RCC1 family protein